MSETDRDTACGAVFEAFDGPQKCGRPEGHLGTHTRDPLPSERAQAPVAAPRWEIIRIHETREYCEGIEAESESEAIEKFYHGQGVFNHDRHESLPWTLKAVRVG